MKKSVIRLTESDLHRVVKESVNRILNETDYTLRNSLPRDLNGELLRIGDKVVYYNRTGNYNEIPYRVGGTIKDIKRLDDGEGDGFSITIMVKRGNPKRTFTLSTEHPRHDIEKYKDDNREYTGNHDDLTKKITGTLFPGN